MEAQLLEAARNALYLILILSAPPVVIALIVGLIVSLIQATTQIQEQTLTFVPKLAAIVLTLAIMAPHAMTQLVTFTKSLLDSIAILFP